MLDDTEPFPTVDTFVVCVCVCVCVCAVSYTHLDVYKRQRISRIPMLSGLAIFTHRGKTLSLRIRYGEMVEISF